MLSSNREDKVDAMLVLTRDHDGELIAKKQTLKD